MRRLILLFVAFLFFQLTAIAQDGWFWQNPLPQGNSLKDIYVFDENTAIAVGNAGTVMKTTDSGTSWNIQYYAGETTMNQNSVYFTDDNTGWIVGLGEIHQDHYGLILKTTDGGKNWNKINNGLPADNHRGRIGIDIAATNPDVLYAYVDNYEIAYKAKPGETDSYGRQKKDVIKGATVYKTTDGGESWVQVSGLTPEQKTYMERHSATYGWVFGQIRVDPTDENTIYTMGLALNQSTDGGKTF